MKFIVTFKTPDAVSDAMVDAGIELRNVPPEVVKLTRKYFAFGEYVDLEVDTDKGTVTVLEAVE